MSSTAGTVCGGGLLGRALAGAWAGGLAAVSTAFLTVVVDGSLWVNPYPLVGALTALALALSACCARWPRVALAMGAGLVAGLCWAVDPRGLPVAVAAPLLVALAPMGWRRRGLFVALALAGLVAGKGLDHGLQAHFELDLRPLASQLSLQSAETRGPDAPIDGATLSELEACRTSRTTGLGLHRLLDDCASQRRELNLQGLRDRDHLPPVAPALALLALCMVPGRWGRRSSLASALVYLPSAAVLVVGLSWVPYVDRYLLPGAALLGTLAPVALVRLGGLVAWRWPGLRWSVLPGPLAAAAWVVLVWPGVNPGDLLSPLDHMDRRDTEQPTALDARQALADWAVEAIGPDDLLLDCSEIRLKTLLLPSSIPVWDAPPHDALCRKAMKEPRRIDGALWLLTVHQRGRQPDPRLEPPDRVAEFGWVEVPLDLDLEPGTHAARRASWLRRWRWPEQP